LFCFFISGGEKEVFPGSCLWELPLAGEKIGFSSDIAFEQTDQDLIITIGDYFSASRRFLSENNFSILKTGLAAVCKRPVQTDQIDKITIFLEKHGAFYHPLKICVALNNGTDYSFVLNGAVSMSGLALIEKEYGLISSMNQMDAKYYLPCVFGIDFIKTKNGRIGFFLGEWFEGYKEFHVTNDQDKRQVVVWDSDGTCSYIDEAKAFSIYQEIARILTCCYNIETFEQIFPWHHAAGDFVIKLEGEKFHVKLISVRGYSPISEFEGEDEDKQEHILPSLLFFFLNLTLRMRFDRLNGTGRTVILGKEVIPSIVKGFLKALDEKTLIYDFGDMSMAFIEFFRQFTKDQLAGIMENTFQSCLPLETALIEENLESHCKVLHAFFKSL